MDKNLIFDLGMHSGDDTEFYLKKGFRVIAVDADPELCNQARYRFRAQIASGSLIIVNNALAEKPGRVTLYKNTKFSEWNTLKPDWVERNLRYGASSVPIEVEAIVLSSLFDQFGVPYYLKVDLEGMDLTIVENMAVSSERPRYVSIESNKVRFPELRHEFEVLESLGYKSFKLVAQHRIVSQRPPKPALEGPYVAHSFKPGSSGLFGEEVPGKWLDAPTAIAAYRPVFLRYVLTDPLVRSRYSRAVLMRMGFGAAWYDTHAKLSI
jgi:FkbM family methyltransferase